MSDTPLDELLDGWSIQSDVFHVAMKPTGDEMARRLRKLKERHQKAEPRGNSDYNVCRACGETWPCPDSEILEGRDGL